MSRDPREASEKLNTLVQKARRLKKAGDERALEQFLNDLARSDRPTCEWVRAALVAPHA